MGTAVTVSALVAAGLNVLAAALGGWAFSRARPSRTFWRVARLGQAAAGAVALVAGVDALGGGDPADDLFWLYVLLPLGVGVVAEQLRIASAETVLATNELENAAAVGGLPEAQQRLVVLAIVRREMAVMAVAAGVVAFLLVRAVGTA